MMNGGYPVIPTFSYMLMSVLYVIRYWLFWKFMPGKVIKMTIPDIDSERELCQYVSLLGREDIDYSYKVTAYDISIKFRWGKTKYASYIALRWGT